MSGKLSRGSLRPYKGPKPTGWVTIEFEDGLLVGELIGGTWRFECDEFPEFATRFNGAVAVLKPIKTFLQRVGHA